MNKTVIITGLMMLTGISTNAIYAQNPKTVVKKDSTAVASGSDRNMMLNASDNKGPREINIGLPSTVGGTTIVENGLPVVYYFWPQLPTTAWRADASIGRMRLMKLGEVAIKIGDVGYAMDTWSKLGNNDKVKVSGQLGTNHFGLIKASANISAPIKDGWSYTASALVNLDPGTYDLKFKTWVDNTQIYRVGLTKTFGNKGEISLLYKFARSASFSNYGPFTYKSDGKSGKLNGFRLGRDSYVPRDGIIQIKELFGDNYQRKDLSSGDAFTHSNTIDIIGNYKFDNKLKLEYSVRYHDARATQQSLRPYSMGAAIDKNSNYTFVYADNPSEEYKGDIAQLMLTKFSERPTPVRSLTSRIELSKTSGNHKWLIGLNEWYYNVDKFRDNSSLFYQEVAAAPRKLLQKGTTDPFMRYNANIGYHDGYENKLAVYAMDEWKINNRLTLNGGMRLTHYTLNGNYMPDLKTQQTKEFHNAWVMKAFTLSGVYNITSKFGVLAEATYNEDRPRLENYSGRVEPSLKLSKIPMGQAGVFFNHDMISLVSAVTYVNKNNYQKRLNMNTPGSNSTLTKQETTYYNVETIGWTTDIVMTPVKNFNLHLLLTLQQPKYKNYSGDVNFGVDPGNPTGGDVSRPYSYSDKIVTGVPKVLIEIDPSYQWNKLKIWASARYFGKQYANLTNSLYFAARWETFAGLNYKYNKHFDYNLTVVNLLNQTGAKGSINGADLDTDGSKYYGQAVSGSYIRPFTVEGSIKFKF